MSVRTAAETRKAVLPVLTPSACVAGTSTLALRAAAAPLDSTAFVPCLKAAQSPALLLQEQGLGHDFSRISVHTDARPGVAAQLESSPVSASTVARQAQPQDAGGQADAAGLATASSGLAASMFEVQDGQPQLAGNVRARPGPDAEKVTIEAPRVSFDATVSLRPGASLGPGEAVRVGPVQTLLGSERVGVYRRGGVRDGEVIAEEYSTVGQVRDAQWDDGKSGPVATVEAPWYSAPAPISDSIPQAAVHFLDQPAFELPVTMGEGRLTETRGQDRFVTSVAAKRGESLLHLSSSNWEVPWNVSISDQNQGQGSPPTGASTSSGPPTTDGPIAMQAGQEWVAFSTVEAAMGADNQTLIDNLIPAKANDGTAWSNIVEALRRKNPTFSLTVSVEKTAEWFGSDEIQVSARGHQQVERGPFSLNDKQSASFTFKLTELFDPAAIDQGTTIEFHVQDVGFFSNDPATMSWEYPFSAQKTPARLKGGGGGEYYMTGSLSK